MSQSPQVVPHRSTPGQRPVYCPNRNIPEYSLTVRLLTESTRPTPFDSAPLSKCDYVGLISLRWTPHLGKLANLIMVPCDDVDATRADTAYPMTPRVWPMDFSVYSVKTVPLPRHRRHMPTARGMALPCITAGLRHCGRNACIISCRVYKLSCVKEKSSKSGQQSTEVGILRQWQAKTSPYTALGQEKPATMPLTPCAQVWHSKSPGRAFVLAPARCTSPPGRHRNPCLELLTATKSLGASSASPHNSFSGVSCGPAPLTQVQHSKCPTKAFWLPLVAASAPPKDLQKT
ncbi:hypothetical protein SELMODRAFT_428228 [Selaginella moellendorffii]|uniref:Uncharacterized protein n=1 Tax=Selaginella moellendorffii TaxID=88036 RepID=D8T255_SELML|nr:hypothetical protein SELMODRAFT_428228 [Selaginella moellendorffii]